MSKEIKCDVLVIGAGPAGSSAARTVAKEGLNVIIADKKERPGKVACAEVISEALLRYLPFQIPSKLLRHKMRGIKFYYKDICIKREGDIWWKSIAINRDEFDPFMLDLAVKEGASYLPLTELVDIRCDSSFKECKVLLFDKKKEEHVCVYPKILIAGDGVCSPTLGKIDKLRDDKKYVIGYIKSHEFQEIDLPDADYGHVYFGEFADGAYGYIFPKSKKTANIGVATLSDKDLEKNYNDFLSLIKDKVERGIKTVDRSGKAPVRDLSDDITYGSIMFVGDAANQNLKPFVEGILPGVICGFI
ncbi:MAG: hypothetical protein DRN25_07740, partial [Thermoplasmata archaeon]